MSYRLYYYNSRVRAEIHQWPVGLLASFVRIAEQIEDTGPNLGMPYTRAMGDGLFEIRARGMEGIGRAFFCCLVEKRVVILHGFVKKTQATPVKDLAIARKRLKEVRDER